jgi:hypothetical protein
MPTSGHIGNMRLRWAIWSFDRMIELINEHLPETSSLRAPSINKNKQVHAEIKRASGAQRRRQSTAIGNASRIYYFRVYQFATYLSTDI